MWDNSQVPYYLTRHQISFSASEKLCSTARLTGRRNVLSNFSNGELMGTKLSFKNVNNKRKDKTEICMTQATNFGLESKLRDLGMERRDTKTVVALILGDGAGTRLFPLTKRRSKPAVPTGGAYRLIQAYVTGLQLRKPMYTSRRNLSPSKIDNSKIVDSIISHGSFLTDALIEHSEIGIHSRIRSNVHHKDTVTLGANSYETDQEAAELLAEGKLSIGIGDNTRIKVYKKLKEHRKDFTFDQELQSY